MILVVGLGNPGMKYKNTYHNLGFMAVDALAKKLGVKFLHDECDAKVAKGKNAEGEFVLAKPQTFMNASGNAVRKLVRKYAVDVATDLVVCYDDVDLPLGKLRMREEGSAGTHNGMRDIVANLQTQNFRRLRVGSRTSELADGGVALIDFVLSKIDYEYKNALEKSIETAADALAELIGGKDFARVQEKVNK